DYYCQSYDVRLSTLLF
nr:immunoglobulin light chain junction region [Macaca mulatta]MOX70149.1 immunoglobulin light chain junction region [Macaca mulatta]MOX74191.1 immunoglobulin light chain junction region [Macaca mulatta]MOX76765.1 immunoglobulin light chain junction region [Macaca mulatta]